MVEKLSSRSTMDVQRHELVLILITFYDGDHCVNARTKCLNIKAVSEIALKNQKHLELYAT